jgi:REP element-mobilizing transposase RayT
MRGPLTELYLHLVWSTWRRYPFITPELRQPIYAELVRASEEMRATVLAIGGMPDHVHVLVRFPATVTVADFVGRIKGSSSHLVTHVLRPGEPFKWQGGYGAFSVSRRNVSAVRAYVLNQEQRHRDGTIHGALEATSG